MQHHKFFILLQSVLVSWLVLQAITTNTTTFIGEYWTCFCQCFVNIRRSVLFISNLLIYFNRDSLIISLVNCGTSVFAGFVIFATVGYMAHTQGRNIEEVASEGLYRTQQNSHVWDDWTESKLLPVSHKAIPNIINHYKTTSLRVARSVRSNSKLDYSV